MITYTEKDINLSSIMRESKLYNLVTAVKYHIYGLRQVNNPVVSIDYEENSVNEKFIKGIKALTEFFKLNEIEVECFNSSGHRQTNIGLRVDLRKYLSSKKKPILASSILSTIIYCLEDRIDVEQISKYKLSKIPKFETKNCGVISGQPGKMCEYGWWDEEIETNIMKIMKQHSNFSRHEAVQHLFTARQ